MIETTRPDGSPARTRIWIVVARSDVFVRSVRGERGHWFQAALDNPDGVIVLVGTGSHRRSIPVRARLANDEDSVARCNAALEAKYRPGASLTSMLQPKVLGTTIRLEPR